MLALYRSGRQAEALRVYADTRRRLVDELGLEPGQALQQLEQAILRHDPSLDLAPAQLARRAQRRRRGLVAAIALVARGGAPPRPACCSPTGGTQSSQAQSLAAAGLRRARLGRERARWSGRQRAAGPAALALRRGRALERLLRRRAEQDRPGHAGRSSTFCNTGAPSRAASPSARARSG